MKRRYKPLNEKGFFDEEVRRAALAEVTHPLKRLKIQVDFEIFRKDLEKAFRNIPKSVGGRPPFDLVLMFKVLILQQTFNISDARTQFLINDSLSMQDFLGLSLADNAPDEKTIWAFRERLSLVGIENALFDRFTNALREKGLIMNKGSIVDASFVEVPIQRNTREENQTIKEGKTPQEWKHSKNASKLAQKDLDARWVKKNDDDYYGYKNHIKVDTGSKIITKCSVTDASVHDSQEMGILIEKEDRGKECWADSAYSGKFISALLKMFGIINRIHEKGCRGKPLTKSQRRSNRKKSRTRARIEHIFGFQENSLGGPEIRSIGIRRATFSVLMKNLLYNMFRSEQIVRLNLI
jgi:IS5 family transposase